MDLIYRGIGVPNTPRELMIDLLGAGEIDVRTAFGWISTGAREFGIGQGSILSILHIACYMDCLQNQLEKCPDPVHITHHHEGSGIDISSTLFVDDQLDVTTSHRGIQARSAVTNVFTGKMGTGGVFGAAKSFMMYLAPMNTHYDAVELNDGYSVPRPVPVVAPDEGFKHLGIYQGGGNLWEATISPVWVRLTDEAARLQRLQISLEQFRYIVNSVWIPRLRYRMVLGGAISVAGMVDTFIRHVARSVLRLPFSTPRYVYYDKLNGIGLANCEREANVHRLQEALRILNTPSLPRLEAYQSNAGLTENQLSVPISPPAHIRTWEAQIIRFASKLKPPLRCAVRWTPPPATMSARANDRPLLTITPPSLSKILIAVNWNSNYKLRYVGDISGGERSLESCEAA
ncbi:hypothetical protein PHYSODRAFT_316842 [Phytophthora sojae]|uniref:Reverse transcriptase domain-containing protein n=1 Tax=Phytophthora sojae (strain P6497) TaxID=1094619 RepID=G4ZRP9_PHYSP|nr:hypothetical protein PHYSODRAFT_316842 [Phytophthora sojae]EGZ13858.1 hypothetical protein PHYSODRAFT_316842 [Phytophthora sojae]|eukprot:XP_009531287.1 hypothetical protein PHYSODRAFT_316842 [Phytophthora sojae]